MLIWSAVQKNNMIGIDNSVKDYRKRLQACVSADVGHLEHLMR